MAVLKLRNGMTLLEEVEEAAQEWAKAPEENRALVRESIIGQLRKRGVVDPEVLVDSAIANHRPARGVTRRTLKEVLASELERMQSPQTGIGTPYRMLNHLVVGGFQKGELIYLGARPGVGKSTMALEIARAAAKLGKRVLIVSREMLDVALARRMLAQEGMLNASRLKMGSLDMPEVCEVAARLSGLPIWITDSAASLVEIESLMDGIDLLIVDYLQLVSAPREIRERRLQVEHSSQGLKAMALRLQVPVVCLSSLARPQSGTNPEPTLASLRESGELEHDADIVMFLHRASQESDEVLCIVAKNRDGETGRVRLTFKADCVSFFETSYEL